MASGSHQMLIGLVGPGTVFGPCWGCGERLAEVGFECWKAGWRAGIAAPVEADRKTNGHRDRPARSDVLSDDARGRRRVSGACRCREGVEKTLVAAADPAEHELDEVAAQIFAAHDMDRFRAPIASGSERSDGAGRQHEMGGRCTDDLGLVVVDRAGRNNRFSHRSHPSARRRSRQRRHEGFARRNPHRRQPDADVSRPRAIVRWRRR